MPGDYSPEAEMTHPNERTYFTEARRAPSLHIVATPKSSIARFVDALECPVVLFSRDGRLSAMNAPARVLFIGHAGPRLKDAIERVARGTIGSRQPAEATPNRSHNFELDGDRFSVTFVNAGTDLATQDIGAMVLLRRDSIVTSAAEITEAGIAARFKLTGQEARVAMLLLEQRSNREIADCLGVSVHTARHHTERVLAKLHIHSRHDVKRALT
jgi:DNA-binding CsgD family transcriptional regulator